MTAVIHHGPPGSYKTFTLVQRVLIPALEQGRVVVTNIRGFNDIDRIRQSLNIDIPPSAQIYYLEPDTEGYQTMARFFHWVPAGALIVMDEGQRVYPTREKRFDDLDQPDNIPILDADNQPLLNAKTSAYICRPATLEIAIDQHRHFNWDIYISTTNIAKIHSEIRKAVEWAFRHRDNSGLLPWYKNTWTEFRHDAEQNGKSLSHYSGTPKRYKADPSVFGCYQSTATGTAKLSNENISIVRDPKVRLLFLLILACVAYVFYGLYSAYDRINKKNTPVVASVNQPSFQIDSTHGVVSGGDIPVVEQRASTDPGLLMDAKVYLVGFINRLPLFEVHFKDGNIVSFDYADMRELGYIPKRLGTFVALYHPSATLYAFSKPPAPEPRQQGAPAYVDGALQAKIATF